MSNGKIAVIGGGIIGCISAIEIKKKGFDVIIFDQSTIGHGSSWAAGGILFPLMPWDYLKKVYDLCKSSAHYYEQLSKDLIHKTGIDPQLQESALTIIDPINIDEIQKWCKKNKIETSINKSTCKRKIILKKIFQIRPPRLMKALRKYMETIGIKIIENKKIISFDEKKDEIKSCATSDGRVFMAEAFLLSSGAWSSSILEEYKNNVFPIKGQMIQYPNTGLRLENILYEDGFYLIPRRDGVLIGGSTLEKVGFNSQDNIENINNLKRKAENIMPELKSIEIAKSWHGFRPGTIDNIPITEKHKDYNNLFLNFGHHRYGVAMAPQSARIITDLITVDA
jgi:glycine oxidase